MQDATEPTATVVNDALSASTDAPKDAAEQEAGEVDACPQAVIDAENLRLPKNCFKDNLLVRVADWCRRQCVFLSAGTLCCRATTIR